MNKLILSDQKQIKYLDQAKMVKKNIKRVGLTPNQDFKVKYLKTIRNILNEKIITNLIFKIKWTIAPIKLMNSSKVSWIKNH